MITKFKKEACKLAITAAALLGLMMFSAVVNGEMALWAGLLLGAVLLYVTNTACGVLLGMAAQQEEKAQAMPAPVPPLRVVRGGRAA